MSNKITVTPVNQNCLYYITFSISKPSSLGGSLCVLNGTNGFAILSQTSVSEATINGNSWTSMDCNFPSTYTISSVSKCTRLRLTLL